MSLFDINVTTIDGEHASLAAYRGRVLLIVNVASRCAFTPQYASLEALYRHYLDDGLVVLGFPCNQFAHQEPREDAAIQQFCSTTYNVSFPLFAKINVNGPHVHPLYRYLKARRSGLFGRRITWNFTKFLVDRDGEIRHRYAPVTKPEHIVGDVQALLAGAS
jgi:glutathione peroxidase